MVMTMRAVYDAGYVAECTFRIEADILREAMRELVGQRTTCPKENPFVLGVGSVINPGELDAAIEMGFDMVVAPANVMGGYGDGADFVRVAHDADVFAAPDEIGLDAHPVKPVIEQALRGLQHGQPPQGGFVVLRHHRGRHRR
jgi:hypothetical protein